MDKIQKPFIVSVVGPKRTGKTTFIKRWLDEVLLDMFRYIVLFSPTANLSNDFDYLENDDRVRFIMKYDVNEFSDQAQKLFQKLEDLILTEGRAPDTLLIMDDCGTTCLMEQKSYIDKYSIRHRHSNLSILAVGHTLRGTSGLPKAFRSQIDMAILFNPNSMSELETILKEVLFSTDIKEARRKTIEVFSEKYNFIVWRPAESYYDKLTINFDKRLIEPPKSKSRKKQKRKAPAGASSSLSGGE